MSVRMNVIGNAIWPTENAHSRSNSHTDDSLLPVKLPTTRHVMNTATSVMNSPRRASSFTCRLCHTRPRDVVRAALAVPRSRAMRPAAIAGLLAAAGCNQIFGLDKTAVRDGATDDAAVSRVHLRWLVA